MEDMDWDMDREIDRDMDKAPVGQAQGTGIWIGTRIWT